MKTNRHNRKGNNTPMNLVIGLISSMGMTLLGSALIAKLVETERMGESKIGYCVMILLIAASALGAITAGKKGEMKPAAICLISGGVYYLGLISITALFLGGKYIGLGETALLVICGSTVALMLMTRKGRKAHRKNNIIRNR